jgi:hypothetical protein
VLLVLGQNRSQVRLVQDQVRSKSSRRSVPTRRSQIAFIRDACKAVRTIVVPVARKTASKDAVKFEPPSRMRNRKSPNRSPRSRASLRPAAPSSRQSGGR